ncbi:MAG: choice-of-anchor D domain-containing protein [Bacteroidota bacterium]
MHRLYLVIAVLLPSMMWGSFAAAQSVFINEFHYDNTGGDTGEFIEIFGPTGTDLSGWDLVLYNGNNDAVYDTEPLSGIIPNQCGGFGTLSFPIAGIQNGSPDGICLVDGGGTPVMFISYEGDFTAVGGPCDGMPSTDIGVSEPSNTPVGQSLQLTGSGSTYTDFTWQAPATDSPGSVNSGQTCSAPTDPDLDIVDPDGVTLACGNNYNFACVENGTSEQVTITLESNGGANLTGLSASFQAGGDTEISISSGLGSTTVSPGNSTTLEIDFSPTSTGSYSRTLRIQSNDPDEDPCDITLDGSSDVSCSDPCPRLESFMVNACNTTEGLDEMIFFATGSSPYNWTTSNLTVDYPNVSYPTFCMSGCGTDNFNTSNTAYINQLNTDAGCPGDLFVAAPASIPANSRVLLFTSDAPTYNHDFSGICGLAPIYVLFTDNSSSTGKFANNAGANRTLTIDFGGTCGSIDATYFSNGTNTGDDGDLVRYNGPNPTDVSYFNEGCTPSTPFLPVQFGAFEGEYVSQAVALRWVTKQEVNNAHFEIQRQHGTGAFETVGMVAGAGNSQEPLTYRYLDTQLPDAHTLNYRLRQVDFDGQSSYSTVINLRLSEASVQELVVYPSLSTGELNLHLPDSSTNNTVLIRDTRGQTLRNLNASGAVMQLDVSDLAPGVYFVQLAGQTARFVKQ